MKKVMTNMKILLTILASLLISANNTSGQSFSISNVDASDFPLIKAGFVALNNKGKSYNDLSVDDFVVMENGISMHESLKVKCQTKEVNPEVSIVIVIDQSESMKQVDTVSQEARYKWVIEGATSFINTIKMEGRTAIAMLTFGGVEHLQCPFTNDKGRLIDSLETIKWQGATRYDPPFIGDRSSVVDLLKERPADMRRIVVFLTDGNPNKKPRTDEIIDSLNNYNIQVYSITLTMPMNEDLLKISKATGGSAFEVYTKDELNSIYKYIALDIQTKQFCWLSWIAPYGCDEASREREIYVKFTRETEIKEIVRNYTAPENSIATVETSEDIVSFDDPPPLGKTSRTISITPTVTSTTITGHHFLPDQFYKLTDWGGDPPPFVLDSGETRVITVQFTQGGIKEYRQSELILEGAPCPPQVTLVGGYSQVRIVKPNGGELYNDCENVRILWSGVDPTIPVDLSYSIDNGNTWKPIVTGAKGLIYDWKPTESSKQYRIKANVAKQSYYLWALNEGGPENDGGRSIAVSKDNLHVYVAGFFSDLLELPDNNLKSYGQNDILLAKYDTQGNFVWAEKAGSELSDSAKGVCVDNNGNVYITGTCFKGSKFGNITKSMDYESKAHMFVARYTPDGGTPSVRILGPISPFTSFQAWAQKIKYDEDEDKIIVVGEYVKQYEKGNRSLPYTANPAKFTAEYRALDLLMTSLYQGEDKSGGFSSTVDYDKENNKYETGTFTGDKSIGKFNLSSTGREDIFISKFGSTPSSEDLCDDVFMVIKPVLEFSEAPPLDMGDCTLGFDVTKTIPGLLNNPSDIKVNIVKAEIVDQNGDPHPEFSLIRSLDGVTVDANSTYDVEIGFSPTGITGVREGYLNIECECADNVNIKIIGTSICTADVIDVVDMGKENIGMQKDSLVKKIFCNTNTSAINIYPQLEGNNPGDFEITFPDGTEINEFPVPADSCVELHVLFKPTAPGNRSAMINYNMPEGCENQSTEIKGEGVESAVIVDRLDLRERVYMIKDTFLTVTNNGQLPAQIQSITLEYPDGEGFTLPDPTVKTVNSGDTIRIPVRFSPEAEQVYNNKVIIEFPTGTFNGVLHGEGYLPKVETSWECMPVKPGETSTAYLVLNNPSTTSNLKVDKVDFVESTTEFTWQAGTVPTDFIIDKNGGEERLPINFSPEKTGSRRVHIEIVSDAYSGKEPAPARDTVEAKCDALGISVEDPVSFGNYLLCTSSGQIPVEVSNKGGSNMVEVTGYNVTGPGANAFTVNLPNNFVVNPGDSKVFHVEFKPTEEKHYEATLHLENSIDQDLSAALEGDGHIIHFYTDEKNIIKEPSVNYFKLPVYAKVAELSIKNISEMTVRFKYDSKMLQFDQDPQGFENNLPSNSWSWNNPEIISDGITEVSGTGNLETPFDRKLFTIMYRIMLSDVSESNLYFQPVLSDCLTPDTLASKFALTGICNQSGRLIVTSSTNYTLAAPKPNPAENETTIEFGVGLEGFTRIEMINTMGETTKTIVNNKLDKGYYETDLRLNDIPAGVYILRMQSGPYVKSQRLVIIK